VPAPTAASDLMSMIIALSLLLQHRRPLERPG